MSTLRVNSIDALEAQPAQAAAFGTVRLHYGPLLVGLVTTRVIFLLLMLGTTAMGLGLTQPLVMGTSHAEPTREAWVAVFVAGLAWIVCAALGFALGTWLFMCTVRIATRREALIHAFALWSGTQFLTILLALAGATGVGGGGVSMLNDLMQQQREAVSHHAKLNAYNFGSWRESPGSTSAEMLGRADDPQQIEQRVRAKIAADELSRAVRQSAAWTLAALLAGLGASLLTASTLAQRNAMSDATT